MIRLFTGMTQIDLQRALIDYEIFLGKLHAVGFSEKAITWFKSYLSDWAFKININNHVLDLSKIYSGVP